MSSRARYVSFFCTALLILAAVTTANSPAVVRPGDDGCNRMLTLMEGEAAKQETQKEWTVVFDVVDSQNPDSDTDNADKQPVFIGTLHQSCFQAIFDLNVDRTLKMRMSAAVFEGLLESGSTHGARWFHALAFGKLDVENLRYDGASRSENLDAICDYSAFRLRFTKYCLDAIEQSLELDVATGGPLGDDVVQAIKVLGITLTLTDRGRTFDKFNHPANVKEYKFNTFPFFSQEAVQYAIRLEELIRSVPVELKTFELYLANYVLGRESERLMVEGMLKSEPDHEELRKLLDYYREI